MTTMLEKILCWITSAHSCGHGGGRDDWLIDFDVIHHRCPKCRRTWKTRWTEANQ